MKKLLISCLIAFLLFTSHIVVNAQSRFRLSEQSEVSLLTCSPGAQMYSVFGHTAIRVKDHANKIDWAYNYGTFDPSTKDFEIKFLQGCLPLRLAVLDYQYFMKEYIFKDRAVYEQILNLSLQQKQAIFEALQENNKPENRYYLYDFLLDNCTTRPRDLINDVLGDSLIYHHHFLDTTKTFRNLYDPYLDDYQWNDFVISLGTGTMPDRRVSWYEHMYLPDYLMMVYDSSAVITNGRKEPLVKQKRIIYDKEPQPETGIVWHTPGKIFWFLFVLVLLFSVWQYQKKRKSFCIDKLLFSLTGFAGLAISLMWLLSDLKIVKMNLNVLWAIPLNLVLVWFLSRRHRVAGWLKAYFLFVFGLELLLVAFWWALPQELSPMFIPVALMLAVRSFYIFAIAQKKQL